MTVLLVMLAVSGSGPVVDTIHEPVARRSCRSATCRTLRRWRRVIRPHHGYLRSIAQCESGRRWHIATGNGFYGGLQFTLSSWQAVGGQGYPHHARPLEQKYRAVLLSRLQGWGAWPVCSR